MNPRPVVSFDHCVIHVSDWARSNAFYRDVVGAEIVPRGAGAAYRLGDQQLNVHGPGVDAAPLARLPVQRSARRGNERLLPRPRRVAARVHLLRLAARRPTARARAG